MRSSWPALHAQLLRSTQSLAFQRQFQLMCDDEPALAAFADPAAFFDALHRPHGEREAISERTKEALAVAKARGVRLGNPNGAASLRRAGKGGAPLRAAIRRNADLHAGDLAPVVADIRHAGHASLSAIAEELNARGMLTRRGGCWHKSTVMNLLDRLEQRTCASPA